ncbi:MAG: class I SAM-dependent methyltransferase [Phycisphaerales bacterium]
MNPRDNTPTGGHSAGTTVTAASERFGSASAIAEHKGSTNLTAPPPAEHDLDAWFHRFDTIYRDAAGDHARIPWAHAKPCPWALQWLHQHARAFVRAGARIAVAGCGLGNDVAALASQGYEAVGIDVSPSAIESAKQRFPQCAEAFHCADLLDLPSRLRHRFDLVIEVHTLQALPPIHREPLARGIATLLKPHAALLAVARGRDPRIPLEQVQGPPYAFTPEELTDTLAAAGLQPIDPVHAFMDENAPPVRRLRGVFTRSDRERTTR